MLSRLKRLSRLWPYLTSALILVLIATGAFELDLKAIFLRLKTGEPGYLLLAFGLVLLNLFLRTLRLSVLVGRPLLSMLPLQTLSLLYGAVTPAKLGEVVKIAGLRNRHALKGSEGLITLVCERILEIAALLMLALPVFVGIVLPIASDGFLPRIHNFYFATAVVLSIGGLSFLCWRAPAVFGIKLARLFERFSWSRLSFSLLASLLVWSVEGLVFSFTLIAFDPESWTPMVFLILPAALVIGSLSGIPSGIGAFDLSLISLLSQTGAAAASVVAALIVYRALSAFIPVLAGLSCLPWQSRILGKIPGERVASVS